MANGQDERKERLAQALRDNLRRRKAQSRESREEESAERPEADDRSPSSRT